MKFVYIIVSNTGSVANRAIKTFTYAPYNHASLSLDKGMKRMYSFGRKKPTNPFWGGFVQENLINGTFSWYPYSTCAVYRLTLPKRNYQKLERIIKAFAKNHKTYLYNYIGLLGVPVNKPLTIPASYFCSQFVAEVLHRSGVPLFSKASALVTPEDFRHHIQLIKIYEGPLYDYPYLHSKSIYHPKKYKSFPFRKYIKQQVKDNLFEIGTDHSNDEYKFRDGFIKPKKILLSKQLCKVKRFLLCNKHRY
ncbi:C40 family peptidase [Halobacillus amylolyticus]|uniref:Uncharacterized protein n=1 Tax=Halobacillus amylolyticus TaxID=2932259 RepID=A0ABY4HEW6_9BACI|nr:hypothetical protein [Halobacillus amylolyticus]UOR13436.1 hypothetical protein MUO15_08265 [Halobacillus amylolyticus]